jgi:hypothetical protein
MHEMIVPGPAVWMKSARNSARAWWANCSVAAAVSFSDSVFYWILALNCDK